MGKNVSCIELARRVDVSPQAIRQFVSGKREPSLWRLHTIADALDVRVRDLFKE